MSKVLLSELKDKTNFVLDFLVEKDEYSEFKEKVIDQLCASTEVKGFRKGKAPRETALKQIDPSKLANTIYTELLDRWSPEALKAAQEELTKLNRDPLSFDLDYTVEHTKELPEGGFQFRIVAKLFPEIKLEALDKLKIKEPIAKDIPDLPTFEEFEKTESKKILLEQNQFEVTDGASKEGYQLTVEMKGELNGVEQENLTAKDMNVLLGAGMYLPEFEKQLTGAKKGDKKNFDLPFPTNYAAEMAGKTAQVSVTVHEVKKPLHSTLEALHENSDMLKGYYPTLEDFTNDIKTVYEKRVSESLDAIRKKRVVEALLETIPDFEIDKEVEDAEAHRIFHNMEHESKDKSIDIGEVLYQAGISRKGPEVVKKMDSKKVHDEVHDYVKSELKLTNILSMIFQKLVTDKPTPKEIEKTVEDAFTNKSKYNIPKESNKEETSKIIYDRLTRELAGRFVIEKARKNAEVLK
jgi:trigger factor